MNPSEQEVKEWYNKRYADQGKEAMRPYRAYPIFLDMLEVEKGKSLLDVSCGSGYLLKASDERGLRTAGIDISEEAVSIATKESPNSDIKVGRGEDIKYNEEEFDYITCLGSLEHFIDMDRGLQEMKRVGKEDAKYLIMVPNSKFILEKSGTEQQDINEHLKTLDEWKEIFERNGFNILDVKQDRWMMDNMKVFESFNPLGIAKRIIYKYFLPLKNTYQFIFILNKK